MTTLLLWDREGDPPKRCDKVLRWRNSAQPDGDLSVPKFLEDHAERLRSKYLAFIHDLGEAPVDGRRIVEHLDAGEGFSLWWMGLVAGKSPVNSPRIYDCLRLLALEEILAEEKPAALRLATSDPELAESVEVLCRALGVRLSSEPGGAVSRGAGRWAWPALSAALQGLVTAARQVKTKWPLREPHARRWFSGENAVFLCSYFIHLDAERMARGEFHSLQWGTLPALLRDSGLRGNWIQHFFFSPVAPSVREGSKALGLLNRDPENQGCHAFLDSFLSWSLLARVAKGYLWLLTVSWRLRNVQNVFRPKNSAVSLWPFLRRDWLSSVGGPAAMSNLFSIELFDAALKSMPRQTLGFYLYENLAWERALLRAWRRYGHGRIVGVQHSTAPFWHLYYFDDPRSLSTSGACTMPMPDRVAVNGPMAWREFVGAGFPLERLVEAEALRYLDPPRPHAPRGSGTAGEATGGAEGSRASRVLVVGDMIGSSTHGLLRVVEGARDMMPARTRFTLKAHPNNPVTLGRYPGLDIEETTQALPELLGDCDVVCAASGTSAALDAFEAGLPVIVHWDGSELNLSPLRGRPEVRFVGTPGELAQAVLAATRHAGGCGDARAFFFRDPGLPRWRRLLESSDGAPDRLLSQ